jgi:hypothetical protein
MNPVNPNFQLTDTVQAQLAVLDVATPISLVGASQIEAYYDSFAATPATYTTSYIPSIPATGLYSFKVWFAVPTTATETILITIQRSRGGVITDLTSTVTIDNSIAWATIHDYSSSILDVSLQDGDVVIVEVEHTTSTSSIRALDIAVTLTSPLS